MALYNNGYPVNYQQFYPQFQQQNYPQFQQQSNSTPQIQNGGFIPVPNIDVARNYQVAPGTSVTFIDENAPYVYTKTRGFSQLDPPVFEKLRLVKEDDIQKQPENDKTMDLSSYALKSDLESISLTLSSLQKELNQLKEELGEKDNE